MSEISAILLSWKREKNLPLIVDSLCRWPRIGEILVWNNNPDVKLDLPGATVINSPQNYYGMARYCAVYLARHDVIWFQDDDMLFEAEQLEKIYDAFRSDPTRIYGGRGRNIGRARYRVTNIYGECDIILGQSMLFQRRFLSNFFRYVNEIPSDLLIEADVIFSLSCERRHFAVDVEPVKEMGWDDEVALCRRPDHFKRRRQIVDLILKLQGKARVQRFVNRIADALKNRLFRKKP